MSEEAIRQAVQGALSGMGVADADVRLEQPKDPSHGDLATTIALTLAKTLKRAPRTIAEEIASRIDTEGSGIESVSVAGPGFLNFRLSSGEVSSGLVEIIAMDDDYGRCDEGGGESIVVEFVSANPTGPLHLGHGRQGAIGDAIAGLLDWTGWAVSREYYYNDAGAQIDRLAESVWARYQEQFGHDAEIPEDGYQGEYVAKIAASVADEHGDRFVGEQDEEDVGDHAGKSAVAHSSRGAGQGPLRLPAFTSTSTSWSHRSTRTIGWTPPPKPSVRPARYSITTGRSGFVRRSMETRRIAS